MDSLSTHVIYGLFCLCHPKKIRYVGKTTKGADSRFKAHINRAAREKGFAVHDWMRKHGLENICYEILAIGVDEEDLNKLEIEFIEKHQTLAPGGMNLTMGGDGQSGFKFSPEQRENLSRGHLSSQVHLEKSSAWLKKYRKENPIPWNKGMTGEQTANWGKPNLGVSKRMRFLCDTKGSPSAKLTPEEVGWIRLLLLQDVADSELVKAFGVSISSVGGIRRGQTWKWVEPGHTIN